jgi:hypothetical protein
MRIQIHFVGKLMLTGYTTYFLRISVTATVFGKVNFISTSYMANLEISRG